MSTTKLPGTDTIPSLRVIDVELLALDLGTCTRCLGTLENIEAAIETVRSVLEVTGTEVRLKKILIESEEQARQHRFVASPTIRINGRDITLEILESECDSCTDLCGCNEGTNCRVWRYQGQEHTEAPAGLVVEALLRQILGGDTEVAPEPPDYEGVPENLRRFFAGKIAKELGEARSCCSPAELETCCKPAEKASCCGTAESEV